MPTGNRLSQETSPYLLQHAQNPVDWWPWGPEAFAEAEARDVPLLISIGYSACHWCHVMAHESFEDPGVAEALNAGFVAVKVDREERPDVDAVYMEAVQLVSGRGGWPMTVLATPDGRPFWGGTYLPRPTFLNLLQRVTSLWGQERPAIEADASRLAAAVRQSAELPRHAGPASLPEELVTAPGPASSPLNAAQGAGALAGLALARCAASLLARHDPEWGGSAGAPKFPQPAVLEVLAQHWWRSQDPSALRALRRTLDAMSSGGIYDHLGGGFARYSTDSHWLVPHFEKMLYDNALLLLAYTYAFQLTGAARYHQVVHETAAYLLSAPLRLAQGAWASAEDADSQGEEGRFYTWSWDEIVEVAGAPAADWYGASAAGNWEGKNILWRPGLGEISRSPDMERARQKLAERRSQRPRPGLDDKVLAEWNAMTVGALAYAGRAFDQPAWVEAAATTAEVMLSTLRRPDGRWLRSWRPGAPQLSGPLACAADYAWLIEAFTRLAEATGTRSWTSAATSTADDMVDLFWDDNDGGFFTYGHDGQPLVARMKDIYDGATPSANSTAARALARLGELTGERRYQDIAERTWAALSPAFWRAPGVFPNLALAAGYLAHPRRQVVVASSEPGLVRPVWVRYLPDTVLAWGEPYPSPIWDGRDGPEHAGLAFACEGYVCSLPVRGADRLAGLLDQGDPRQQAQGTVSGVDREA